LDSEAGSSKKSAHHHNEAEEPEIPTSKMLPRDDEDDEYNLKTSSALEELLADAPVKPLKSNTTVSLVSAMLDVPDAEEEEGGDFTLCEWI
jgi:hypothetical protein